MRRVLILSGGLWVVLIVSLAFNIGFGSTLAVQKVRAACAGPCEKAGSDGVGVCEARLFGALELSEEQARQLGHTRVELMERIAGLRGELALERARLGEMLAAEEPNEAGITAQLDRIAAVQRQVQEAVVAHLLAVRAELNEDQRAAFNAVIRERICPCAAGTGGKACDVHVGEPGACPRVGQH